MYAYKLLQESLRGQGFEVESLREWGGGGCIICLKRGSAFNTRSNDLCIERVTSGVAVRGEGGVAGEGTVVGIPKFHSWSKCTMPLNKCQLGLDVQRFL